MKAIIVGATSGIGRELAEQMSRDGYIVGITGRRSSLLNSLEEELSAKCFKSIMDLKDLSSSVDQLKKLIEDMDGVDVIVINSGVGYVNPKFRLEDEIETVAVNVAGFTAIANVAYHYFCERGQGHIVSLSSIAAIKGGPTTAYNASKAYISKYMEGLSCRAHYQKMDITFTDIRPGFVDTAMVKGKGVFWMAPVEKAAKQIFIAIKNKKRVAYITKRWRIVALFLYFIPFSLYQKIIS